MKVFILTLGCPRNLVDSEVLEGLLLKDGHEMVDIADQAEIAIVNTCGFIEVAKQESITNILQLVELKKEHKLEKIYITGCLAQRYAKELFSDISEIDGIFGTGDFDQIPGVIADTSVTDRVKVVSKVPDFLYDHNSPRKILTTGPFAYVKIQEGCSNRCTYCVIPDLKGPLRSRQIDSVVKEVSEILKKNNISEIILIGQDTTAFGIDKTGNSQLVELLDKVSLIAKNKWVRLLYTHPAHFSPELIELIASRENICNYIDIPIQHSSDRILGNMNRKVTQEQMETLICRIRSKVKPISIRTSVIVGYPGETEEDFNELTLFIERIKFDRLGAFIYSREEGTAAYSMKDQVPEEIIHERFDKIMQIQQKISHQKNSELMGSTLKVLIDGIVDDSTFLGRSFMDAPEVDGMIYISDNNISIGDFVDVKITGYMEYDLVGEVI